VPRSRVLAEGKTVTDTDLAWASGFFEGEGSILIRKPTLRNWGTLVVSVVNTDRVTVEWFHQRWRGYFKSATRWSRELNRRGRA
jgi:hypothetical protein